MKNELISDGEQWKIHNGDCIPHMLEDMPESSVDVAVFSPPFPSLYAYTDSVSDIGNVDAMGMEAKIHLGFFFTGLARVLKPGRAAIVHVCQIPRMKRSGGVGLCDFRGLNIRLGERAGLVYEYDWSVRKNPQAQAIRTRSRELQFAGLESDRAAQRGTLQDYLIKFRKPGENQVKIDSENQVSRNDWIIRRCVLLYSNPGEIVFSPFTGIGSEGYVSLGGKSPKTKKAIADPRRFYGCELKPEYFRQAVKNLDRAINGRESESQPTLFD